MRAAAMSVALGLAALFPSARATAHHTSAPTGRSIDVTTGAPARALRLSALGAELASGASLFSLELDGQVGFAERFAARMRAPFHYLSHDGEEEMGPGDVTLGGEALIVAGRLRLALGADIELPTGDVDRGLGHGAPTVAPQASAQVAIAGGVRGLVQSSLLVDLTDPPAGTASPAEQQDQVELRAAGGAVWERGPVAAAGFVRLALPLSDEEAGRYFTLAALSEVQLGQYLRGGLFAEVPLGQDRRIDWRAGLTLSYRFSE